MRKRMGNSLCELVGRTGPAPQTADALIGVITHHLAAGTSAQGSVSPEINGVS